MRYFLSILLIFTAITFATGCGTQKPSTFSTVTQSFNADRYEKQVLYYINKVRQNPKRFYNQYVENYIKENSDDFTSYYTKSLRKRLLNQQPLPPFQKSNTLQSITLKQLHYLTHKLKGRKLTHKQGSISFSERIKGSNLHRFAENLYRATKNSALEVVLDLLIDQNVRSLGHRKNILNKNYKLINIQSAKASNGYIVTVMDFGSKKE
ncbi:MAG TPA: hypothetical protein VK084_03810 [Chitinophagaceae bacterium]|nr:hypothetical protein [Chitinophagaceae bacterium]